MAHPKTDFYRAERAKGKTYRQIADEQGVSYQSVANSCGPEKEYCFRGWTPDRCIYPNLRQWLNDNRVTLSGFIRKMGLVPGGGNPRRRLSEN